MRLGVLTSHPIQYQAPWFRALAKVTDLEVFFAHRQSAQQQAQAGFGVAFDWDVDLLSGYQHRFLVNASTTPGVNQFSGCDTPEIEDIIAGRSEGGSQPSRSSSFDAFIIMGWYLKTYLQAARACRRAGVRVLVRGDSHLRTPRPWWKRLGMQFRQRWLLRRFDGFLCVGQRHREYLQHYGVSADRIFFAPHFVDNDWFAEKAASVRAQRSSVRKQWGAEDYTLVVLFVGKLQPIKRPGDILQALAALNHQDSTVNSMAVFVGSGELQADLRAAAASLGVNARFEGFRNQTELPRYYTAADVLVLPSESETWGLVVNEAMACGLPVIAADTVGCLPDLIEDGKTGFGYPVANIAVIVHQLRKMAKLVSCGTDFGHALREKLRTYSVNAAVTGTLLAVRSASGHDVRPVGPIPVQ